MSDRVILHLDMDAFFAAIEQRDRPELRGKPVLIGHAGRRGVVATCSYEARAFGVHSAMPSVTAERRCPDGIWVQPRISHYREESRRIFGVVETTVPVLEKVSVDEAYGDLTGVAKDLTAGAASARRIKQEIVRVSGLTASAGVAQNRFLAKIGSDLDKPDGLTVFHTRELERMLGPLSVRVIPGVGPKLGQKLDRMGIRTIVELRHTPESRLKIALGARTALFLARRARGEDDSPIGERGERQQISEERTYREDLTAAADISRELLDRAEGVAAALRRRDLLARTVVLKARDSRFRTVTRSRTLDEPTDLTSEIYETGCQLMRDRVDFRGRGLRLLGLGVKELCRVTDVPRQLFPDERRTRERLVARTVDGLRKRFGAVAPRPARLLEPPSDS